MLILITFLYLLITVSAADTSENKTETPEPIQVKAKINDTAILTSNDKTNQSNVEMMRITKPSVIMDQAAEIKNITLVKENSNKSVQFRPSPQIETYIEFNNSPIIPDIRQISPKMSYLPPPSVTQNLQPPVFNTYNKFAQPSINFEQPNINFEQPPARFDQPPVKFDQQPVTFDQPPVKFDQPVQFDQPPVNYGIPSVTYRPPNDHFNQPNINFDKNSVKSNTYLPPSTANPQNAQEKQLIFPVEKPVRFETDFPSLEFYEKYNYSPVSFKNTLLPNTLEWFNKFMYPVKSTGEHHYPHVFNDMTKQHIPNIPYKPIIILDDKMKQQRMTPWKRAAKFLAAIVPIGLLLSALTPNIITLTPNNETQYCRKLNGRSETINKNPEFLQLWSKPGCEARLLCETAVTDNIVDVETVKNLFWTFVSQNAEDDKTSTELEAVSNAIQTKTCDKIPCREQQTENNN